MEETTSLLSSYQKLGVDEMRHKLSCTLLEFEQFKNEASEELRNINEYVCQLIQFLKIVSQERDEARNQLQKLLNKGLYSSTNPYEFTSSTPMIQNESHVLLKTTNAGNSSVAECNSLFSEAHVNYNSHASSASFFDVVSSPDLSNIHMTGSNNNVGYLPNQLIQDSDLKVSMEMPKVDYATLIMDNLMKAKPLPQKGKFLQSVLDVPPLLHTLLLAGPVPKWCNPPRLQTFQMPAFSMQDPEVVQQVPVTNLSYGSSQMPTTQMFNFTPSGSCLGANTNSFFFYG